MMARSILDFLRQPLNALGAFFLLLVIVMALMGNSVTVDQTENANDMNLSMALLPPGTQVPYLEVEQERYYYDSLVRTEAVAAWKEFHPNGLGTWKEKELDGATMKTGKTTFLAGTDRYGRDYLSRIFLGARVSLKVGFLAVVISILVGLTLGLCAGYFRGWTDRVIMWLVNVIWSVPTLLIAIALMIAFSSKGLSQVVLAIGLTMWVELARIIRGQVLQIREMEYIQATRVLGLGHLRTLLHHILPNLIGPLVVVSASNFAAAILLEAGLSFLGLGVQPPTPSWGNMVKEHFMYIVFDGAYLALFPGVAILILVMAFNLLGNGLRDSMDINLK
jgi:peptide/nickel transport system permease protein